jgi:hypothetical protein
MYLYTYLHHEKYHYVNLPTSRKPTNNDLKRDGNADYSENFARKQQSLAGTKVIL